MINLAVVDDQNSVVNSLRFLIENIPGVCLVGWANNGIDAIKIVEEHQVDIVLMDITMPIMNGIEATKIITQRFNRTKVILLTSYDSTQMRILAIQAGANGYISKLADFQNIDRAINLAKIGGEFFNFEHLIDYSN